MWFGFPCGTFSAARRHGDGGPPPLRGINPKDINGLPGLQGKDLARVQSANALLKRMHELMKLAESVGLPFYFENPLRSKLWIHPIIKKWIRHHRTTTVQFDYCQFGLPWMKPTQILAYNNRDFNVSIGCRCAPKWKNGVCLCSRTGQPHEELKGLVPGTKQFKTAVACPYPQQFCELWAPVLTKPRRYDNDGESRGAASLLRANPELKCHVINNGTQIPGATTPTPL